MPHKDHEKKRAYHREYMRRRRVDVKPDPEDLLNPGLAQAGSPQRIDPNQPYIVESRYPWPAYLVQNGYWFDPKTGELVGKAS